MRSMVVLLLLLFCACSAAPPPADTQIAVVPSRLIAFWDIQTDTLTPQDAIRDWQFIGRRGDEIRIDVQADADVPLTVSLRRDTALAEGRQIALALAEEGTYTVRIHLSGDTSAAYTIALAYTNRPTPTIPSPTPSDTLTPSPTRTPSATQIPSATHTLTPSQTPTSTETPTETPTASSTPTPIYAPLGTLIGGLTSGLTVSGTFISSFERHIYTFEGAAGQFATLQMVCAAGLCPASGVDPVLTLYDSQGMVIATDDNTYGSGGALLRNIVLPADGTYYAQAVSSQGTGDYALSLSLSSSAAPVVYAITVAPTSTVAVGTATPLPGGDQLHDHVPAAGSIDRVGGFKRFFIAAEPAQIVTIAASPAPGSALLPRLQIVNPGGEVLFEVPARADNGGDALVPALSLLEGGVYSVFVTGDQNTTGAFIISYGKGASHRDVQRGEALPDQPVASAVERRGLRDVWTILLNRSDVVSASVRSQNPGFDPALALVAPDGTVLASGDNEQNGVNPAVEGVRAPVAGLYQLRVTGVSANSFGSYQILWQRTITAPTATPRTASYPLLTADDTLPEQSYLRYPFQGRQDQRIRIQVIAISPGLDPVADLVAPDGAVIAQGDDGEDSLNPEFEAILPAAGTYMLRISGYNGSGGVVEVLVEGLE